MKEKLVLSLMGFLIKKLPQDIIKRALDSMLDVIEDKVKDTENKVDDAFVLPICAWIRQSLDIIDDD